MSSESLIASTTQFQTLLIAFVLIVAVIYFFIELRRIEMRISSLEVTTRKILSEGIPSDQLSASQPSASQPSASQPSASQPSASQPSAKQPSAKQPSASQPSAKQPSAKRVVTPEMNIIETDTYINDDPISNIQNIVESVSSGILFSISSDEPDKPDISIIPGKLTESIDITLTDNNEGSFTMNRIDDITNEEDDDVVVDVVVDVVTGIVDVVTGVVDVIDNDTVNDVVDAETIDENPDTKEHELKDPELEANTTQPLLTEVTKYQDHTIKNLKDILSDMDLPTSGNKTKLIQRIIQNKISN